MPTDRAPSIAICKADVEAEVAYINAEAEKLCAYLNRSDKPWADVIRNIVYALLATAENPGPGNWKLVFSTRNGRPPKSQSQPASAAQAIAAGQAVPAGMYLLADSNIDDATRRLLADVLDPKGTSKWQLKFARASVGNPRTDLRADLENAAIGLDAEEMRDNDKLLKEIYYAMGPECRPQKESASPTRIKAGLAMVKTARPLKKKLEKKPLE